MTPFDLIALADRARSPEELVALAAEQKIKLSAEDAQIYFDRWHGAEELSDDELDLVGGGAEAVAGGVVCEYCNRGDALGIDVSGGGYYCYACKRACRGRRV